MGKTTVITDFSDVFDSEDGKFIDLKNAYPAREEVPDDPSDATSFAYKLTQVRVGYPPEANSGILFGNNNGNHILVSNAGVHIRLNGIWELISSGGGGGGGVTANEIQAWALLANNDALIPEAKVAGLDLTLTQIEATQQLQETDITTLQEQNASRVQEIGNLQTEQTSQQQEIDALKNSGRGPLSRAAQDFDSGLEEVHTAGDRIYTAPFNSVTEFDLKAPVTYTGDTNGIVQTNLPDDNVIGFSGLANNIYKIIALLVTGVPANDTVDIVSYRIPEHNNIIHHLLRISNGNYILGNPHPTVGNSDTNVASADSATIAYEDGDWVVLSPAPLDGGTNGVEFNVLIRRANGTIIQANTITFNDPEALSQLHLDTLYFHTHPGDNTQAAYVDKAVVGEHSGQHYLTHSTLAGFDFTASELGLAVDGEGSDTLTFTKPIKFTGKVVMADIQAVIYRDENGDAITLGTEAPVAVSLKHK